MSLSAASGGAPVTASWTYIDGLPGLNVQVDSWLLSILDAKTAPPGGRYRPAMALNTTQLPASGPGTTLTEEPVEVSGTVIVLRENERDTAPDGTSTLKSRTVYADIGTGEVHSASELLKPDALPGILTLAPDAVKDTAPPSPTETPTQNLVLDPDGSLEVTTANPGTQNRPAEAQTVTIGTRKVENALNPFGRTVLSQIRTPTVGCQRTCTSGAVGLRGSRSRVAASANHEDSRAPPSGKCTQHGSNWSTNQRRPR
ncbi:hypothetical protein [Pseudarthrobacter albicanus]|uniref:hypothetical protein n=1 Tax=Pseudarthrobacter albicanus TaxID=2823873 RepID=UPI001BA97733|nr:hypothetical protein [Pseudarthrobacter albicanus]